MIRFTKAAGATVLIAEQTIKGSLDDLWQFASKPENLSLITPPEMHFTIVSSGMEGQFYGGKIISYKVSPFPLIRVSWITEITHVSDKKFFVDEQRVGPYALWHHEHHFEVVADGVKMTDIVHYRLPMGAVGQWLEPIVVRRQLNRIFEYRKQKLDEIYS